MKTVQLRLPATSANLGPGFDAMALALELFLEIDAVAAAQFSVQATGRNPNICGGLTRNLLIETYRSVLAAEQRQLCRSTYACVTVFQWVWDVVPRRR